MKSRPSRILASLAFAAAILSGAGAAGAQDELPDWEVRLSINRGTRNQYLSHITDQTGYMFLYDSRVIRNDQTVHIPRGGYTLREAIVAISGQPDIEIRVSGNHIILVLPEGGRAPDDAVAEITAGEDDRIVISGMVCDLITGEPIPYCSVHLDGRHHVPRRAVNPYYPVRAETGDQRPLVLRRPLSGCREPRIGGGAHGVKP